MLLHAVLFPVLADCFLVFGADVLNTASPLQRNTYTGVSIGHFQCHKNHKLSPSLPEFQAGQTTKVDSSMDCGFGCTKLERCFSYNFGITPDGNGKHVCELLSTDKYNNSNTFQEDADFHHFSIKSPCSRRPCVEGRGHCIPLYYKNDYQCACLGDFKGKRCETYVLEVYIKGSGCGDYGIYSDCLQKNSSIQVNGVEYSTQVRGHNFVVVNMDGTIFSRTGFDTHGLSSSVNEMSSFINSIPTGKVVLVATQDSADAYYDAAALKTVGAVNPSIKFRECWYLIGYKGESKSWIQEGLKGDGLGPTTRNTSLILTL